MVYILPLFCFVIPLIIGVLAVRHRMGWLVPVLALLGALFMAWAIWKGRQTTGFDGIGYAITAVLMAAPAILGVLWRADRLAAPPQVPRARARRGLNPERRQ